jgi:hypothetical protein
MIFATSRVVQTSCARYRTASPRCGRGGWVLRSLSHRIAQMWPGRVVLALVIAPHRRDVADTRAPCSDRPVVTAHRSPTRTSPLSYANDWIMRERESRVEHPGTGDKTGSRSPPASPCWAATHSSSLIWPRRPRLGTTRSSIWHRWLANPLQTQLSAVFLHYGWLALCGRLVECAGLRGGLRGNAFPAVLGADPAGARRPAADGGAGGHRMAGARPGQCRAGIAALTP